MKELTTVQKVNQQLQVEWGDEGTRRALMATTFNGLSETVAKQAVLEAMLRGFDFKDFLEKDVYAVKFGNGYTLITSINHARKLANKNGLVGKSAPEFTYNEDGSISSCSITVKRLIGGHIGEFSDTVHFDEYTTDRNLWKTKPKTMIAKVAEMHALRMAFPEDLSQTYVAEENEREIIEIEQDESVDLKKHQSAVNKIDELEKLKAYYKKNEGLGKDFAKMITTRKKEINGKNK